MAASAILAPGRSHDRLAEAITTRVQAEAPLFKDDDDRRKTSALLVAIAFRESSLRADAVGDFAGSRPTSFCAFQLHLFAMKTKEGWSGQDLLEDPDKCVAVALRLLRDSMKACPTHPIAWYAAGPSGCTLPRAQRISRDRMMLAQRLTRDVRWPVETPGEAPSNGDDGGRGTDPAREPESSDNTGAKAKTSSVVAPTDSDSAPPNARVLVERKVALQPRMSARAAILVSTLARRDPRAFTSNFPAIHRPATGRLVVAIGPVELDAWRECTNSRPVSRAGPSRAFG
jgi:hypothetical protein